MNDNIYVTVDYETEVWTFYRDKEVAEDEEVEFIP